ncbi:hypothetical protein LWM68_21705 [Niabella sp. W65]|jgi:hypothetical protein|nr:hypothetical protein [Niabella sp. W65]MCH7365146.1 hypothetical protein [Niabella sp. W65]ULT40963.1 hypothetical protein KRR40_40630 [Niabella sp. I65]
MKILLLAMTLALFASCNNSSNQDAETSDTTMVTPGSGDMNTTTPGSGDMNTTPGTDTTQSSGRDTSTFEGAANDSIGK